MNTADTFIEIPTLSGRTWVTKCTALAALVVAGWASGHLQTGCLAAIVIFGLAQGFLPHWRVALDLREDKRRCHEEKLALQRCGVEYADKLGNLETTDAGSLYRGIVAVERSRGRMDKKDAIDRYCDLAIENWLDRLTPIKNAAEQCPQLGLGGSLLGMCAAISSLARGGEDTVLYAAMSTMVSTTLLGLVLAIVLRGLYSIDKRAIERHDAELRMVLSQLYDVNRNQDDDSDPDDTFFGEPR